MKSACGLRTSLRRTPSAAAAAAAADDDDDAAAFPAFFGCRGALGPPAAAAAFGAQWLGGGDAGIG